MTLQQLLDYEYVQNQIKKKEKAEQYRELLNLQIEQKRQKEKENKEQERRADIRHLLEYDNFFKFQSKKQLWHTVKKPQGTDIFGRAISYSQSPPRYIQEQNQPDLYTAKFQELYFNNNKRDQIIDLKENYANRFEQQNEYGSKTLNVKKSYKIDFEQNDNYQSPVRLPTKLEALHMKPTNNFEEITEEEFERRERIKSEYRIALQQQMQEAQEKKLSQKKKDILNQVQIEKRLYKQLHDMQQDYIQDEIKKGNSDVRSKIQRIAMLAPLNEEDVLNVYERKRDRSKSKSKSPDTRISVAYSNSPQRYSYSKKVELISKQIADQEKKLSFLSPQPTKGGNLKNMQSLYQSPQTQERNYFQENVQSNFNYQPQYGYEGMGLLYDAKSQLDRLSKLQDHIQDLHKQSQIDNLKFEQDLLN